MSVLGKDLFDFQRSHTNTKVEFGASGYWVEMVPEMQPYGTVLTEILNLDVTPFQKLLDRLNAAVHERNYDDAPRAYMDMQKGFGSLPLYRLYLMDFRYFGDMKIEEFVGEEVREAFAKYVINEECEIPSFMQQQIKDIQLIQERYAWFLDRVFANAVFEKKKGQRKESLAQLIYSSGYEAFVSGVSLGKDPEVDAPLVRAQYRIRGERENAEVVEKMYFDRLLDFVYVELMKGLAAEGLCAETLCQLRTLVLADAGYDLRLLRRTGAGAGRQDLPGDRSHQQLPQQGAEQRCLEGSSAGLQKIFCPYPKGDDEQGRV